MNKVDELAQQFLALIEKFEQLLPHEQDEVYKKVGWPARTKLYRVRERKEWGEEPAQVSREIYPEDHDLILRVPEVGSEEKRKELKEFLRKRGKSFDELTEFVFFHVRPKWYETPDAVQEDDNRYIGEIVIDDLITIHVQYDKGKLIKHLRDVVPVIEFTNVCIKSESNLLSWYAVGPGRAQERGENPEKTISFDRRMITFDCVLQLEDGSITLEHPNVVAPHIREWYLSQGVSKEDIDFSDNFLANEIETGINTLLLNDLALFVSGFYVAAVNAGVTQSGDIPADVYKKKYSIAPSFLRPWGKGRRSDPDRKTKYREFVDITHKRKHIAECLSEFARDHYGDEWLGMLAGHREFKDHCKEYESRGYNLAIIEEAAQILYRYQNDNELKIKNETAWKRATSALGVARVIASLELGWRDKDESPLTDPTKLSERYSDGNGSRWGWKENI